jgi:hypothetical protein
LLLASCRYVGNRAADFLDQFRGAVGVGTTLGVRGRALGVVDTGLMVGVQPRAAALGWRYGTPLYFSEKDPRMDAEQAEIFRTTSVYGLDYATGTYKSARTSIALLPAIFTRTDATPSDYAWLVPENGEDFHGRMWIWNRENRKTNRYARIHAFDIEADEVPLDAPDDCRRYKQGEAGAGLVFDFYIAHHLTPYWMAQPRVRPNEAARETEMSVKDTMLWTWDRLLRTFPTKPGSGPPWPPGCDSDEAVLKRIEATASGTQTLEAKIALLKEIETFERGRHSSDPKTGEPTDDARVRYKVSQAAWASRFERAKGRRLQVEDDLIRVAPPER